LPTALPLHLPPYCMHQSSDFFTCPICGNNTCRQQLLCTDYTVSHQQFGIAGCNDCSLRFTHNAPEENAIGPYYQADSYISHTDTDKGLISKLYKAARSFTLRHKRRMVQGYTGLQQGKLLDVGAGTGVFAHAMQQAGWQVTGLEPDSGARQVAIRNYGMQLLSPESLFQQDAQSFDAITLWHVLEHVHNLHGYLQLFGALLKPNGRLLIAVPNYTSADATHYAQYWAAYDVPRHLYHFSPQAMRRLAGMHRLEVQSVHPMWLDAFYIALLSEQYKTGRQRLVQAFWQGLGSNIKALLHKESCSSLIYILRRL